MADLNVSNVSATTLREEAPPFMDTSANIQGGGTPPISPTPDALNPPSEPMNPIQLQLDERLQRIAVRVVMEDYSSAKAARDSKNYGFDSKLGRETRYENWIQQLKDLYFGYRQFKDLPWRFCSNRSLMIAMAILETLHARMFPGCYNEEMTHWKPTTVKSVDRADHVEQFMFWWIRVHVRMRDFFDRWVRHAIGFGRVMTVTSWDVLLKDRGIQTNGTPIQDEMGQPVMGDDGAPMQIPPEKILDRIEKSRSDIVADEDIFLAKGSTDLQRDPVIIRRTYFYRELEEMERDGKVVNITLPSAPGITPLKNLLPVGAGSTDASSNDAEDEELKNIKRRNIPVEVLQEWTGIDLDGDTYPEQVYVLISSQYNLYLGGIQISDLSARGERHIDLTQFMSRLDEPHGLQGMGILEMVKELALEIDAIFNQMTDGNTLQVLKPGFYDPGGDLTAPSLFLAPNKWAPVSNPQQSIYVPEINVPTEKLIMAIRLVNEFIEKLTGASAYQFGNLGATENVGGSGTATRTSAIVGASNERHEIPTERLREGIARIMNQHLDLVQMNLPPGLEDRVLGDKNEQLFQPGELTKEALAGDFDCYLLPDDAMGSKESSRQLATMLYQTLMQNPIVATDMAKLYKITSDLLKSFGKDPESYLGPRPDILNSFDPQMENELMIAGDFGKVKATVLQNPIEHVMGHMQIGNTPSFQMLHPQGQQQVAQAAQGHIQEHVTLMQNVFAAMNKQKGGQGGQPPTNGSQAGSTRPVNPTEAQPGMGSVQNPASQPQAVQRRGEGLST